jgi:hypothetical protein
LVLRRGLLWWPVAGAVLRSRITYVRQSCAKHYDINPPRDSLVAYFAIKNMDRDGEERWIIKTDKIALERIQ